MLQKTVLSDPQAADWLWGAGVPHCKPHSIVFVDLCRNLYRFNGGWNHGQRILSQPMLPREPLNAPLSFRSRDTVSEYMGLCLHQCSFDKTHLLLYNYRHSDLHTAFHHIEMLYCITHNAGLNRIQDDKLNIKTFFSCSLLHLYSIIQR